MKINELPARFDAQRHLQPLWRTEAVYDETALIVGETGECTLAFLPRGGLTVRSYTLDRIFREGVDFSRERFCAAWRAARSRTFRRRNISAGNPTPFRSA